MSVKKILIMGHTGFVGSNLSEYLKDKYGKSIEILGYNSKSTMDDLEKVLTECDFVFDLAAVHRPKNEEDFTMVNYDLLDTVCKILEKRDTKVPVVYTSSIQCGNGSPYGISKGKGEERVLTYSKETGTRAYVLRLTNTYGPKARPNGHSVVATFCYNLTRDIPIRVDNRESMIRFCYIDDVLKELTAYMEDEEGHKTGIHNIPEECIDNVSVGELADLLNSFKDAVRNGEEAELQNRFEENLYNTYVSYLPEE
jgi:UDP-2-acetamido-2,6-beta-L-arabino-hexul-4-ose reductase